MRAATAEASRRRVQDNLQRPYSNSRLAPEGIEMLKLSQTRKETENQVKLLQNRLSLLQRQEQLIVKQSNKHQSNMQRMSHLRGEIQVHQKMVQQTQLDQSQLAMEKRNQVKQFQKVSEIKKVKARVNFQNQKMSMVLEQKQKLADLKRQHQEQKQQTEQLLWEAKQEKRKQKERDLQAQSGLRVQKQMIAKANYNQKLRDCQLEIQSNLDKVNKLQEAEQELIVRLKQQTQKLGFGKNNLVELNVKEACDQIMRGELPNYAKIVVVQQEPAVQEKHSPVVSSKHAPDLLERHDHVPIVSKDFKETPLIQQVPILREPVRQQSEAYNTIQEKSQVFIQSDQGAESKDYEEVKDSDLPDLFAKQSDSNYDYESQQPPESHDESSDYIEPKDRIDNQMQHTGGLLPPDSEETPEDRESDDYSEHDAPPGDQYDSSDSNQQRQQQSDEEDRYDEFD